MVPADAGYPWVVADMPIVEYVSCGMGTLGIVGMASIVCTSFRGVPDIAGAWNLILVSRRTGRRHNNQQLRGIGVV